MVSFTPTCAALALALVAAVASAVAAQGNAPVITSFSAQADTLKDEDFVFDLTGSDPVIDAAGGQQFVMNQANTPGLRLGSVVNKGAGQQILFKFQPCGFRAPHVHPRAFENFFVIFGQVKANIIRESGGLISNNASAGTSGFFPVGHAHFLQNDNCFPAVTLSVFENMDPGVHDTASVLNFPTDTIQVTLGNRDLVADQDLIADVLPQSIACLKRCGLWKGWDDYEKKHGKKYGMMKGPEY